MTSIYGLAKICPYDKKNCDLGTEGLSLEPDLEAIMADTSNREYEELVWIWDQWREASGKKMREYFGRYVELNNQAARANSKPNVKLILCLILLLF